MITLPDSPITLQILARWERFAGALAPDRIQRVQTEDVVAALIDRSLLQQELDDDARLSAGDLVRLDGADRAFRGAAPTLLDRTEIALYRDDEPITHWWWHIEQLVLGSAGELLLDVPQAAGMKGVHPHTIRAAVRDGHLPSRRLARGFLIHRRDLERWEPRRVGRPTRGTRSDAADALLEGFNAANTQGDFATAGRIAEAIARDPATPRRKLALALDGYNRSDFETARRWAGEALTEELPDRSRQTACLVLGRSLLAMGKRREARAALEAVRGAGSMDAQLLAALADVELASGSPAKAVVLAREAVTLDGDQPDLLLRLAWMEWHANQVTAALEHVTAFRTKVEGHAEASILYGSIMGVHGDRSGESDCYERAIAAVRPWVGTSAEAARIHASALARLGRVVEATRSVGSMNADHSREPDWQHALEHAAEMVAEATFDAGTDQVRRRLDRLERAIGRPEPLRMARAKEAAVCGDLGRCMELLNVTPDRLGTCDADRRRILLMAGLRGGRAVDVLELARIAIDEDDSSAATRQIAVSVALAADDLEITTRGLRRLASEPDLVGLLAATALKAMEAGERRGRERAGVVDVSAIFGRWTAAATVGTRMAPAQSSDWRRVVGPDSVVGELVRNTIH